MDDAPMIVRSSMPQNVMVRYEISDRDIAKLFSFPPKREQHEVVSEIERNEIQSIVLRNEMLAVVGDEQAAMPIGKAPKHFVSLCILDVGSSFRLRDGAHAAARTHDDGFRRRRQRRVGFSGVD